MPTTNQAQFSFTVEGFPESTFEVIRFRGVEGLSRLYDYSITLISGEKELDLAKMVNQLATFSILTKKGPSKTRGFLAELEQLHSIGEFALYRARLAPRAWRLTQTRCSQAFLDMKVADILPKCFEAVHLQGGHDVKFSLQSHGQDTREYVCQYNESHFDFISRWMEREGVYYFFDHEGPVEQMVVTDTKIAHQNAPLTHELIYQTATGMEVHDAERLITALTVKERPLPKEVILRDYNYRRPDVEMIVREPVDPNGFGEVFSYGDHFQTQAEGKGLGKVRAEEILASRRILNGKSPSPFLRSGFLFSVKNHYRGDVAGKSFLCTEVRHEGGQERYLEQGLGVRLKQREQLNCYRNTFTAIPSETQFRPARTTDWPRFHGSMNARISVEGSGEYAELDDQGRYKTRLPIDKAGFGGHATAWLRMAQPYVGAKHGMHLPLHKDTEVLLTFIDGDVDRPLIAAALPNPDMPSVVKDKNNSQAVLRTAGQNRLLFEDKQGKEYAELYSPHQKTLIRLGNDPDGKVQGLLIETDKDRREINKGYAEVFTNDWRYEETGSIRRMINKKDFESKTQGDYTATVEGNTKFDTTGNVTHTSRKDFVINSLGKCTMTSLGPKSEFNFSNSNTIGGGFKHSITCGGSADIRAGAYKASATASGGVADVTATALKASVSGTALEFGYSNSLIVCKKDNVLLKNGKTKAVIKKEDTAALLSTVKESGIFQKSVTGATKEEVQGLKDEIVKGVNKYQADMQTIDTKMTEMTTKINTIKSSITQVNGNFKVV